MRSRTRGRLVAAAGFALVAMVATAIGLFVDPLSISDGTQNIDVASISRFDVDLVVESNGTMRAVETIVVDYPIERRGIFRVFDTADPRRDIAHPVSALSVTRDGQPEPWVWQESAYGTQTARIGREDLYLQPGSYTYQLIWTTTNVLEPGVDDPDSTLWWWDAIGSGWQMPIAEANVTVTLPASATSVECVIGASTVCQPVADGSAIAVSAEWLQPFTPLTLRAAMPAALVAPNAVDETNWFAAIVAGIIGAAVGLYGWRVTRERTPGFPVLFEPPHGVRPAVGTRVLDEANSKHSLQATLFDLGDRGVVSLRPGDSSWSIELIDDPAHHACDDWELSMLHALGLHDMGDDFVVAETVASGTRIAKATEAVTNGVNRAAGLYLARSVDGTLFRILGWVCGIGVIALSALSVLGGVGVPKWSILGVGAIAVFSAVQVADTGSTTTRTKVGRDVWSRTGGFARFLSTESSESRFDAAAHLDWFPQFLPWAVALGVSDEWAKRYAAQQVDLPTVPYIYGISGVHGYQSASMSNLTSSFSSAISSASSAYAASQSSSSGGGFSGGSGGGGGGGGSW